MRGAHASVGGGLAPLLWAAQALLLTLMINLTLIYKFPVLSFANKFIGGAFVGLILAIVMIARVRVPAEIILYFLFVFWAVVTGSIIAASRSHFFSEAALVAQIGVLILGVACLSLMRASPGAVLTAALVSALFLLVTGMLTGQYELATEAESRFQFRGTLKHPNAFGFYMIYGITAALYFWTRARRQWQRHLLLGLAGAMVIGIVLSASRKNFLAVFVLLGVWLWYDYRRQLLRNARVTLAIVILTIGAGILVDRVMATTYLGTRIQRSFEGQLIDPTRQLLYERGVDVILRNPIFGVGLGNYRVASKTRAVSHSDYVEVTSSAGFIGAGLYFSIFVLLWRRLDRIRRMARSVGRHFRDGLWRALIVTVLALGLGKPNFNSIQTMVLLAAVIGYIIAVERFTTRNFAPTGTADRGPGKAGIGARPAPAPAAVAEVPAS